MRLTNQQRAELEILRYFIPSTIKHDKINDNDIALFFAWSDRGDQKLVQQVARESQVRQYTGATALYFAKRNRDLQITSYHEDWGHTCTAFDFIEEPQYIAEYISKSLKKPAIMGHWHENKREEHRGKTMKQLTIIILMIAVLFGAYAVARAALLPVANVLQQGQITEPSDLQPALGYNAVQPVSNPLQVTAGGLQGGSRQMIQVTPNAYDLQGE